MIGAEYCDQFVSLSVSVCLSVSISLEPLDRSSRNLLCRSPVAMTRSFSGDVVIRYVLPVLWMTSRLAIMHRVIWQCVQYDTIMSDVYECLV